MFLMAPNKRIVFIIYCVTATCFGVNFAVHHQGELSALFLKPHSDRQLLPMVTAVMTS